MYRLSNSATSPIFIVLYIGSYIYRWSYSKNIWIFIFSYLVKDDDITSNLKVTFRQNICADMHSQNFSYHAPLPIVSKISFYTKNQHYKVSSLLFSSTTAQKVIREWLYDDGRSIREIYYLSLSVCFSKFEVHSVSVISR